LETDDFGSLPFPQSRKEDVGVVAQEEEEEEAEEHLVDEELLVAAE
jgi:hypothetical protein